MSRNIYLIGSLRNKEVPNISHRLRAEGHLCFDDWFAAGPEADDYWQAYEKNKGNTLPEALKGYAAKHVFEFDKSHLDRCDTGILVLPAGRSGHLELGYMSGKDKDTAILMAGEPDRYDVMYKFANLGVFYKLEDLLLSLENEEESTGELAKPANDLGNRNLLPNRRLVPVCAV